MAYDNCGKRRRIHIKIMRSACVIYEINIKWECLCGTCTLTS